MNEIDWSKAPEGATHAEMGPLGHPIWYAIQLGKSYWWRQRSPSDASGDWASGPDLDGMNEWETRPVAPWSGQGLPLMDTTCEWLDPGSDRWIPVKVVFLSYWVIVVRDTNYHPEGSVDLAFDLTGDLPQFRVIRTPEQIAAEERDKAVHQMGLDAGFHGSVQDFAKRLYALGYRKTEGGAE